MSKERLEEIKQRLVLLHNASDVDDETKSYIFEYLKVEWLIERVQELDNEVENLNEITKSVLSVNGSYAIENIRLKRQNKRYREALRKIIKEGENGEYSHYTAQRALEEKADE